MFSIQNSTISISRGDTATIDLVLYTQTGTIFTPSETQTLTFYLYDTKENLAKQGTYGSLNLSHLEKPIYKKSLKDSTLYLEPKDTIYLTNSHYRYQIDMAYSDDIDKDGEDDSVNITVCNGDFIILE